VKGVFNGLLAAIPLALITDRFHGRLAISTSPNGFLAKQIFKDSMHNLHWTAPTTNEGNYNTSESKWLPIRLVLVFFGSWLELAPDLTD
jgi:hypothetical protein